MRCVGRATALTLAIAVLLLPGVLQAQPGTSDDRSPARPGPAPGAPAGPTTPPGPGGPTAPPEKKEEPEPAPPPPRAQEPIRVPEELTPRRAPSFVGPDLFNPPAHQGWITLTPSLTLSAEYNDNIFLDNRRRQSDVILGFTPGLTFSMQRRGYRLQAGYNVSGQIFLDDSDLSDFGKEQQFFADYSWEITPNVTLSLSDRFVFTRGTNTLTSGGTSVGFEESFRNTAAGSLRWQATANTGVTLSASQTLVRFESSSSGDDSDTYRVGLGMDYMFTPRLRGTFGVGVARLEFQGEPSAWSYTPFAGLSYDITPTLRAYVNGGPSITERRGDVTVTPAVATGLTQLFKFGSVSIGYDRAVTAETVGISDRQAVFAAIDVLTLARGLRLGFSPRYSIVDTDVTGTTGGEEKVKTLSLTLDATYQLARNISLIGAYTFYQQSTDRRNARDDDLDQNRVFFGIQYAFPITIY